MVSFLWVVVFKGGFKFRGFLFKVMVFNCRRIKLKVRRMC